MEKERREKRKRKERERKRREKKKRKEKPQFCFWTKVCRKEFLCDLSSFVSTLFSE